MVARTLGKAVRTPMQLCLHCGTELDAVSAIDVDAKPDPDDVTVCIRCAHVMAFDEKLTLRELTPEERIICESDGRIQDAIAAIQRMKHGRT